ncbi:hypothetical protein KDW_00070 [Dictyobacter vulcani]|uniref:valine--tRNA ligase n=1 Tax=Dictyobacter vulcani TaxID=2607529 RepID=A0A5J4KF09_9CHLR|nr:hypothetical protein KDW_00070 [Dictyobacter vulcani]
MPVDPRLTGPNRPCSCGSTDFDPEQDVMDTWATSSCSPLIIGRWINDPDWFQQHFPASLRPQAHDIIRTWAFYTIVKALYHCDTIPWKELMVSGHALSTERNKLSKSKSNSTGGPLALMEQESADALRYWATSIKPGNDTVFNLEAIAVGRRLITKLWNACRFAESRLQGLDIASLNCQPDDLLPTDRWLLSRLSQTITFATRQLEQSDYATARAEVERFFWTDLCDNYLELAKSRLYKEGGADRAAAQWTLYHALLTVLKIFAPYIPFVTEEIYLGLFQQWDGAVSIHTSNWPVARSGWLDEQGENTGKLLLEIVRQVRRYKAEQGLSVGATLECIKLTTATATISMLQAAQCDIQSATRAQILDLEVQPDESAASLEPLQIEIVLAKA